jgi:hypothetical protein
LEVRVRGRFSVLALVPLGLVALALVACSGEVDSTKDADDSTITAGEEASFTITVVAEPTGDTDCLDPLQAGDGQVAGFGIFDICVASGTIDDPLPEGIDWEFEILQNTGDAGNSCMLTPGPGSNQETLDCLFAGLEMPIGTVTQAGVFSVRVFGLTDPNDCPRTLTNVATVVSGFDITIPGPTETEMPTDTIEVVCPAGTVIEPPDIDPIGDPDPDIDISATPSTVFPTPGTAVPDTDGPSVGTGDSGLAGDDDTDGLLVAVALSTVTIGGLTLTLGAILFARR